MPDPLPIEDTDPVPVEIDEAWVPSTGRAAYEADVRRRPLYHDGSRRKSWDELDTLAQWSWNRPSKDWPVETASRICPVFRSLTGRVG